MNQRKFEENVKSANRTPIPSAEFLSLDKLSCHSTNNENVGMFYANLYKVDKKYNTCSKEKRLEFRDEEHLILVTLVPNYYKREYFFLLYNE